MNDNLNITIKIADVAPLPMTVRRENEAVIREAERAVNRVWKTWRKEFDTKSSKEVLAMVAWQFARLYFELSHSVDEQQKFLTEFEAELDSLLQIGGISDTRSTEPDATADKR